MAVHVYTFSILGFAAVGAVVSAFFIAVTYRWIRPDARWIPVFCRMDENTCARIVDTNAARIGGLPNAVYGLVWYVAVMGAMVFALVDGEVPFCPVFLGISLVTVLVSVWLAWVLIERLKTVCFLCFAGHTVNAAIFGLLVAACAV